MLFPFMFCEDNNRAMLALSAVDFFYEYKRVRTDLCRTEPNVSNKQRKSHLLGELRRLKRLRDSQRAPDLYGSNGGHTANERCSMHEATYRSKANEDGTRCVVVARL